MGWVAPPTGFPRESRADTTPQVLPGAPGPCGGLRQLAVVDECPDAAQSVDPVIVQQQHALLELFLEQLVELLQQQPELVVLVELQPLLVHLELVLQQSLQRLLQLQLVELLLGQQRLREPGRPAVGQQRLREPGRPAVGERRLREPGRPAIGQQLCGERGRWERGRAAVRRTSRGSRGGAGQQGRPDRLGLGRLGRRLGLRRRARRPGRRGGRSRPGGLRRIR